MPKTGTKNGDKMRPAGQNRPTSQRGKCNPKKHQNCCTKLGPTKIAKRNNLCPEPKPDCGQVVQQRRCQWQCVWPRFESYSARGCVLRFLAASMPRRRGDGGQLVLPVWSTCSGLFWVFAIWFSRFQLFGILVKFCSKFG